MKRINKVRIRLALSLVGLTVGVGLVFFGIDQQHREKLATEMKIESLETTVHDQQIFIQKMMEIYSTNCTHYIGSGLPDDPYRMTP